ncbi:MAG: DUF1329 domain-containing protein [Desulfobacterales bacterium]
MQQFRKQRMLTTLIVSIGLLLAFTGVTPAATPKPGDVIDSSNIDRYQEYFPMFMQRYIKDGWGIEEPVVIKVREHKVVPLTKGYIEASKKNMETCKLTEDGMLEGYSGSGAPFPELKEPNIGLKAMWNQFYKNFPDDWLIPTSYLTIQKRKGSDRVSISDSTNEQLFFSGRTQIEPLPELNNPKNLFWASKLDSKTPPNKDMATLTWRYKDPTKFDDMWTYVPTLRRTLRLVSSERANPVRGTAYTWDDFYGFDGKIPFFTYKLIGEQTVLNLKQQASVAEEIDRENFPWHPVLFKNTEEYEEFEPVPCYVIEIRSKDPRYPQDRKIVWLDKTRFFVLYAQMFDKKGEFWKGFWNGGQIRPVETTYGEEPMVVQSSSGITDFKTGYWVQTLTGVLEMNKGADPNYFQPGTLGTF